MKELNTVLKGDCLHVLKTLPSNSVDSIVTDPPYELGFMGKAWDNTGIANNKEMWTECLRVLKPGGHLLAFSGTRTYHRMASAIEDAGFEVRDMIEWVYGSGFPKSLNIGKAVDKLNGADIERARKLGQCIGNQLKGKISNRDLAIALGRSENSCFIHHWVSGNYIPRFEELKKLRHFVDIPSEYQRDWDILEEEAEREIVGQTTTNKTVYQNIGGDNISGEINITKGTSEWEGWGTALKPAHEPICMARKPLAEKTVAENVLKYGTGGINIDESRVEAFDGTTTARKPSEVKDTQTAFGKGYEMGGNGSSIGRFPANLIHDNSEEVRECFPDSGGGKFTKSGNRIGGDCEYSVGISGRKDAPDNYGDSGNASRFFKSIKIDEICPLCCLPFVSSSDTMSVCKNTNVNSADKSLKTTQATTEVIAQQNATTLDNKKFAQNVRSVVNLCDLCVTYIAHELVGEKQALQEEEVRGQVFITEQRKQILDNALASFVELRGEKDTIPTINDLNLLFGYVFNAIENFTIYSEQGKEVEKNHEWKSLLYQAKASKKDRGKGNTHATVKPTTLMEYLIKMVTPKGGTVLDPFAGSGSTLVAAKQNGFYYIGIEKEQEYIEIINKRLAQ